MNTGTRHPLPARLHSLAATAALFERLESAPSSASAEQYRAVAHQLTALLAEAEPDAFFEALLGASPATAELYENMRYAIAGLCRSPLEAGLNAELAAAELIARVRRQR